MHVSEGNKTVVQLLTDAVCLSLYQVAQLGVPLRARIKAM